MIKVKNENLYVADNNYKCYQLHFLRNVVVNLSL